MFNRNVIHIGAKIIGLLLFILGAYHGIILEDYARGCFDILISGFCLKD